MEINILNEYKNYKSKMDDIFDHDLTYSEFTNSIKNNYGIIMKYFIFKKKFIEDKTTEYMPNCRDIITSFDTEGFDSYPYFTIYDVSTSIEIDGAYLLYGNKHISFSITCNFHGDILILNVLNGLKIIAESKMRFKK